MPDPSSPIRDPRFGSARPARRLLTAGALPWSLSFLAMVGALCLWHWQCNGELSPASAVVFAALVSLWLIYGSGVRRLTGSLVPSEGAAFALLTGFFAVNSLLFVLTIATPLAMSWRIAVVCALGIVIATLQGRATRAPRSRTHEWASLACIVLCAVAATLWTTDLHPLTETHGDETIFKAWPDIFIHARQVSLFAASHGLGTIFDIRTAGVTAPLYHVAPYITPAAVTTLTHESALAAIGSVQLPMGIVLSGLGAFVLARPLFGTWPAAVAAIAVVTLPDTYQQGVGLRLLAYHFMSQVNLGTLYGIACACLAWLFVLEGCRRNRLRGVAVGFGLLLVCLTYKAHIFVANALPMLMFPCFFFAGLRVRTRVLVGVVFLATFVGAIVVLQGFQRVPLIRLDGSGLSRYVIDLVQGLEHSRPADWFGRVLTIEKHPRWIAGPVAAALVVIATFGVWTIVTPLTLWSFRRRMDAATAWFPIVVVANYLMMALGLARDDRAVGAPEELLNRPAAWAWFVVVVWTVAAGYRMAWGEALPKSGSGRVVLVALLGAATCGVVVGAHNVQTYPAWKLVEYSDFEPMPTCALRAAQFIRAHARPADLMQDQANDPRFTMTAIAERQAFAIDARFGGASPLRIERLDALARRAGDGAALRDYLRREGVAWYLMHPPKAGDAAGSLPAPVAFECGGYRVWHVTR